MSDTLSRSNKLVNASWEVITSDRKLLVFPLMSTIPVVIAIYLGVWAITAHFGVADTIVAIASENQALPASTRTYPDIGGGPHAHLSPGLYVKAIAIAPLLLHASFANECGPLCGTGNDGLYLWIPTVVSICIRGNAWIR